MVVINDGSKDRTGEVVGGLAAADPRVRLSSRRTPGKSEALRRGVELARHDLLVFLDADTLFQRDTLRHLVAPFADPQGGRGVGPRAGRQPAQLHRALPGARIHLRVQPGPPRLRRVGLHHGRARRGQRGQPRGVARGGRLPLGHAGRGHRPDPRACTATATASATRPAPWRGRKRPRRSARWPSNVSAGASARCNVSGNTATCCSTRSSGRWVFSACRASGFSRSSSSR